MNPLIKRKWALVALVPAVLLIAAGADREPSATAESVAEVQVKAKPRSVAAADAGGLELALQQRPGEAQDPVDAFASKSWYVPPPPPPPSPPRKELPAAPTVPPLPYTYLGRYQEGDKPVIFLVKGDRVLTVKAGDILDGNYRVDGIVGSTLNITYLPLKAKQTLEVGASG